MDVSSGPPTEPASADFLVLTHPKFLCDQVVASPELAAAVTNAGGLGVFGGVHYAPWLLRQKLEDLVVSQLYTGEGLSRTN